MAVAEATKNGLTLVVTVAKNARAGHAIPCEVRLRNGTEDVITYGHISDYRDFMLDVRTPAGESVPLTCFGQRALGGDSGVRKKFIVTNLKPGESLVHAYNLARLFDLTLAGEYVMTVRLAVSEKQPDSEIHLASDPLTFTISE